MSYETDLIERYRAVRERLTTAPVGEKPLPVYPGPTPTPTLPPRHRPSALEWREIVREVATEHGLDERELMQPGYRPQKIIIARHEAFYRLRHERLLSLAEIGRLMGGFDHTTVLHGIRRHDERMEAGS